MTEPLPYSSAAAQPPPVAWYHTRPGIIVLLVLIYPVGLVCLLRSPRPRAWEKIAAPIGFLPAFAVVLLLLLKPYWDFGGGTRLSGFRIDFTKGRLQDRALEAHRESQRAQQGRFTPGSSDYADLSWPAFRGANRDGVVIDRIDISLDWVNHPPRELWRQPVGEGYSAFVVGHGRIYTLEQRRDTETVTCYDIATGHELWAYAYRASFEETLGGDGPRATPTLHDGRIFALGAEGHLTCLDAMTGRRHWERNILDEFDAPNLDWALSASPLIVDNKVIVTNSGLGEGSIMAFNAETGELVWKTDVGQQGYASPMLVTLAGRRHVLNMAGESMNGIDADDGKLIWSFPWKTAFYNNCAQPVAAGDDALFLSSGYGKGCALIRIESANGNARVEQLWSNVKMKNKFSSSVIHDGYIYGLDERVLACLDLETGQRKWKGGRYGHGSLLLVGDHLLLLSERGLLVLIEATPEAFQEIGQVQILHGRTWNNTALVGGLLFARNHKEMACYDLKAK